MKRGVIEAITDAIKLTERVERIQKDMDRLADLFVDDSKRRDQEFRDLDRRVQRIENLIEFSERHGGRGSAKLDGPEK